MAKSIIDAAALTALRSQLRTAQRDGNIMDRVIALEAAFAAMLEALEAAK